MTVPVKLVQALGGDVVIAIALLDDTAVSSLAFTDEQPTFAAPVSVRILNSTTGAEIPIHDAEDDTRLGAWNVCMLYVSPQEQRAATRGD